MKFILLLISIVSFGANCPKDVKNVIIMIDSCPTSEASYITDIGEGVCSNNHAEQVIKTYKLAGGKKKIWLFTALRENKPVSPYIQALKAAILCNIKVISTSTTSAIAESYSDHENYLINQFVIGGGRYYAAAGNYGKNLMIYPVYPAAYENVFAVGAKECNTENPKNYVIAKYSNYGMKVKYWHCGQNPYDMYSRGTSFATPRIVAEKEG